MANFPTSISTNANLYIAVNGLQTTLANAINASVTTITLTSTSGFPTTGLVTINNLEVVSYTGISGADLTGCIRGADGTTALTHNAGVTVGATVVAAHHNLLKDEVIAIEQALGTGYSPTTRGNLDDLNNVIVPSPSTNDLLAFNGTNWVNVSAPATSLALTGGTMTGDIIMSNQTGIVLRELAVNGTAAVTLKGADDITASYTLKFPPAVASAGQTLVDAAGNGVLSWAAGGAVSQYATYIVGTPSGTYTGSTTVVNLPFAYPQDGKTLQFFYNGQMLTPAIDYTETSTTSISLAFAMVSGARIMARTLSGGALATAVTHYREDYIVGTASGSYTGSLTVFNLSNSYTPGGTNLSVYVDGDLQTVGASVDYLETSSTVVTFVNPLVSGQKVAFKFAQSAAPAGTVSNGTSSQLAYYTATGVVVAGSGSASHGPNGILVIDGAAANPSYSFGNDLDTGIWRPTNDMLGFATGGVNRLLITSTSIATGVPTALTGTTTNNNASAGEVGEHISSTVAGNLNASATGTYDDGTSISLTAGDWDVTAGATFEPNGATWTLTRIGISTTSGNSSAGLIDGDTATVNGWASSSTTPNAVGMVVPTKRFSLSATTTVYLKRQVGFSAGTPRSIGIRISARRVR